MVVWNCMEDKQPTIQDVLDLLSDFRGHTDEKFDQIDSRFEQIDSRFERMDSRLDEMGDAIQGLASHIDERFDTMDERFDALDGRVTRIESTMVTKDYLDEKLNVQKWDITKIISAENDKVLFLAGALQAEGSLSI